jgi:hypothetical protein
MRCAASRWFLDLDQDDRRAAPNHGWWCISGNADGRLLGGTCARSTCCKARRTGQVWRTRRHHPRRSTAIRGDQVGRHCLPGVPGHSGAEVTGSRAVPPYGDEKTRSTNSAAGWRQGFVSNITNPKVLGFYLAVLPRSSARTHHSSHSSSFQPRRAFLALPSPPRHRPSESPPRPHPPTRASRTRCRDRRRPSRLWRQARGGQQIAAQPPPGTASARTEKDRTETPGRCRFRPAGRVVSAGGAIAGQGR